MKPFLEYRMATTGDEPRRLDESHHGRTTGTYNLAKDPGETHNLGAGANLSMKAQKDLASYPVPSPEVARAAAPRPADMTGLFELMDKASGLFAARGIRRRRPAASTDPCAGSVNLDATLRFATAHSLLGQEKSAMDLFRRAGDIAPKSQDVRTYLGIALRPRQRLAARGAVAGTGADRSARSGRILSRPSR